MKHGSMMDLLGICVVLAVVVVSFLLADKVITAFNDKANATMYNQVGGVNASNMMSSGKNAVTALNLSVGFIILMVGLTSLIFAFFIPTHPIFLPLSILLWIVNVFLSIIFSNVLWAYINNSALLATATAYPITVGLVQYLPHIIAGFGLLLIFVMHGRSTYDSAGLA